MFYIISGLQNKSCIKKSLGMYTLYNCIHARRFKSRVSMTIVHACIINTWGYVEIFSWETMTPN